MGGSELLSLTELRSSRQVTRRTGLYHFALLLPCRRDLALALKRIWDAGAAVQGVVDHWVSESIYLADPDGNGIEVCCDRPKAEWPPYETMQQRGNRQLNPAALLSELFGGDLFCSALHPETIIGHIHLHVGDLRAARKFYEGILGFERPLDFGDSATFVSAGGYHHHIAFNTWTGSRALPPPPDAVGLKNFLICLPTDLELKALIGRICDAGLELAVNDEGVHIKDPSQNGIIFTST